MFIYFNFLLENRSPKPLTDTETNFNCYGTKFFYNLLF